LREAKDIDLFFSSPNQLRWWVTTGFGRDAVLTLAAELNDCMAVGASQALAWVAMLPHLESQTMAA